MAVPEDSTYQLMFGNLLMCVFLLDKKRKRNWLHRLLLAS